MGCGCNKGRAAAPLPQKTHAARVGGSTTSRIAVYEVMKNGVVKTSTTSSTAARSEARRIGGSVRVTSRTQEKVPAQ
jgi:hypothetical protein